MRRYSLLSSEHESVSVSHSLRRLRIRSNVFAHMSHKLALELHWIPSANNTTKTMSSARDPPPNPPPFNPRLNDARHPLPPPLSGDSDRPVFVRKAVQRRAIDYTANNLIHSAERAYTASLTRNPIQDSVVVKPTSGSMLDFPPSWNLRHVPASSFALKFVHVSANKIKTPINKGNKWLLDLTSTTR